MFPTQIFIFAERVERFEELAKKFATQTEGMELVLDFPSVGMAELRAPLREPRLFHMWEDSHVEELEILLESFQARRPVEVSPFVQRRLSSFMDHMFWKGSCINVRA